MKTPFYDLVPKDRLGNLEFRRTLIEDAAHDPKVREELWIMCARDPLFYVNSFVWMYSPREREPEIPFITFEVQDEAFEAILDSMGEEDVLIEKSRELGASWICLTAIDAVWRFQHMKSFMFLSRTEDMVDKTEDPDSLFWKLDYIERRLPKFLKARRNRQKLHLLNLGNGSVIDGASTTGNAGRGGRRTCIFMDEFASFEISEGFKALASTQSNTKCRLFNSTPQGVGNAYASMALETPIRKVRMHWSDWPEKAQGLYTSENAQLKVLDEGYDFPGDYQFILDGKLRSPYYDKECERCPIDSLIAQELDIDYLGSGAQFFNQTEISRVIKEFGRKPFHVGTLDYDAEDCTPIRWTDREKGDCLLWLHVDAKGDPPRDRSYVIGVDISGGTGASNSVISVGDKKTGEKVAEFCSKHTRPEELASIAVSMARWFKSEITREEGAYLIWEANGPGRQFGARVLDLGYRNVFYRRNETSIRKKQTDQPGWYTTKDSKRTLLAEYGRALATGEFVNRSIAAVRECGEYVFGKDGSIVHSKAISELDPSGSKDNHGDRVIADALCWRGMRDVAAAPTPQRIIPKDCFYMRRKEYQDAKRERQRELVGW